MPLRYPKIVSFLHWLMVLLLAWLIYGGLMLDSLGLSAAAAQAFLHHKLWGLLALGVALVRLALRLVLKGPGHELGWRGCLSLWVQRALYGLMLAYPLSGYLLHSSSPVPAPPLTLGGWHVPKIQIAHEALWRQIHEACLTALTLVLALHLAGALFHFLRREGRGQRISPF